MKESRFHWSGHVELPTPQNVTSAITGSADAAAEADRQAGSQANQRPVPGHRHREANPAIGYNASSGD